MQNGVGAKNNQRKEAMEGRTLKVRVGLHLSSNVMSQSDCDSQAVSEAEAEKPLQGVGNQAASFCVHWREKMNT